MVNNSVSFESGNVHDYYQHLSQEILCNHIYTLSPNKYSSDDLQHYLKILTDDILLDRQSDTQDCLRYVINVNMCYFPYCLKHRLSFVLYYNTSESLTLQAAGKCPYWINFPGSRPEQSIRWLFTCYASGVFFTCDALLK